MRHYKVTAANGTIMPRLYPMRRTGGFQSRPVIPRLDRGIQAFKDYRSNWTPPVRRIWTSRGVTTGGGSSREVTGNA